jgi:hypothetical protein
VYWQLSLFHTITGAWTPVCLLAPNLPVEAVSPPRWDRARTPLFYRKSAAPALRAGNALADAAHRCRKVQKPFDNRLLRALTSESEGGSKGRDVVLSLASVAGIVF